MFTPEDIHPADPASAMGSSVADRALALCRTIAEAPAGDDPVAAALTLACDLVPAARWASVTRRGRAPKTVAATDAQALALDEAQYRAGAGPCLTALDTAAVVTSDFATEPRWSEFVDYARTGSPARASLSIPLAPAGRPDDSLNLYADTTPAFGDVDRRAAGLAAAGVALAMIALDQRRRAEHLETALASSRFISAAIGILMHRHRMTYEDAFEALRTTSQQTNRKLRELAEDVMLTGTLPG